MAEILVWLRGKEVVLEVGLELDGDELDDDEDEDGWWITNLGEWTVANTISEVVVKEGVFTVGEYCAEISVPAAMRVANSTDFWR